MKNPLIRRLPRELAADWHKYLVIIVFMIVMIGVISGMYVGHDSMLAAVYANRDELDLEDGCFELSEEAEPELLEDIASGKMAYVRQYFIDKGTEEADKEVAEAVEEELEKQVTAAIEDAVRQQCAAYGITDEEMIQEQIDTALEEGFDEALDEAKNSAEFKEAEAEAYEEAHKAVTEAVDEEWDEIADRYSLEDEGFTPVPVRIYENFYREEAEDDDNDGKSDANVRIYLSGAGIDRASFLEGRGPGNENEIAIDRLHAENLGVKPGDSISIGGKSFEVSGLLSYVNYLTLHEKNTDLMFDSFGFDVAMVTPEGFDRLSSRIHYNYSYIYEKETSDKTELADMSENFLKVLITQSLVYDNEIKDYLPEYLRQASNFAPGDIESDTAATGILCYILIGVIAFIFAITISNTIDKEASVIGTLRASGYKKSELVVHYMSMPLIVTLAGAVLGNIFGYTFFRDVAVNLYYQSYSMPACGTVWSKTALVKTTLIPLFLMFFVNLIVIVNKLQLSPLRFLRHDLGRKKRSKAVRLPAWSFMRRFRLRILLQNLPNYAILIFGVIFIELMMSFAFGLPDSLNNYSDSAGGMLFADYQYMLMDSKDSDGNIIETSEESAERFSSKNLMYPKDVDVMFEGMGSGGDEGVTVYGIAKDSSYISLGDHGEGEVYLSSAFAKKFGLKEGDRITLKEEYENRSYTFSVKGTVDYDGGIAVFMGNDRFNALFDRDPEEFSGYFSRKEINDIDEQDIAVVITAEDITKVTTQLFHSVGGAIDVFKYALIVLAAALIYLLAKIIIERNEHAISMVKILGFENGEIASLYILPTAMLVVLFAAVSVFIGYALMGWVFKLFIMQMDGYFEFYMKNSSMVLSVVYLLAGYALVSVIDLFRIKKIPLDVALKNVE
ncbi:MAG: permease [Lachnospiraceae bacterium]|nr:permease [Lachnospiraceae bacterium]